MRSSPIFDRVVGDCRLSRCVTFRDILSKGGTLFYSRTLSTGIKIKVYVLDDLDTIPKKSEADIALCREKKIKKCQNFKRTSRDSRY
jgi:hypothetical protein